MREDENRGEEKVKRRREDRSKREAKKGRKK